MRPYATTVCGLTLLALHTNSRELAKDNGGVAAPRHTVWCRAAHELEQLELEDSAHRSPKWIIAQWHLRISNLQSQVTHSHSLRPHTLKA